ncbi:MULTISPECIES: hypothetical protein [unclassified Nostoc]|nr:hypothetical protein [Nostocales cyanobacterium LEGE 12452]
MSSKPALLLISKLANLNKKRTRDPKKLNKQVIPQKYRCYFGAIALSMT